MEVCVDTPGDTTSTGGQHPMCPIQAEHQSQCRCGYTVCRVSSLAVAPVVVSLDSSGARGQSANSLVLHTSQLKLYPL